MVVLRSSRASSAVPFALAAVFFVLGSTRIGYQDIASLMAQQPHVADRARERMIASPFGTIHMATFSLPRPVGTAIPEIDPTRMARFDAAANPLGVNRGNKGDLQVPRIQIQILSELLREDAIAAGEVAADDAKDLVASLDFKPFPRFDPAMTLDPNEHVNPESPAVAEAGGDGEDSREADKSLYFDARPALANLSGMQPWDRDEALHVMGPMLAMPVIASAPPGTADDIPVRKAIVASTPEALGVRLQSPADRLRLTHRTRAKAEKCLANAIYFEARSEPVRGQIAVAQVIINRAFSGYYPEDICGVVYQNAHRHLSCQFTFACDGIPDVVTEPEHWGRAQRIATAALDGKIWLGDVGLATHYHASYVYPYWVRSMRKLKKIGLHTFYRPRKWSEGEAPTWETPAAAELVAKM
jgi:hypothetical protein